MYTLELEAMTNMQKGKAMRQIHDDFLQGNNICHDKIRDEILDSWYRCKSYNVDPNLTVLHLPEAARAKKLYQDEWAYMQDLTSNYISHFSNFLKESDACILYIDADLNVIVQRGAQHLIEQLSNHNISVGANLSENSVGTNAAALAMLNKKDVYVVGAEHYCEAFFDYACYASRFTNWQNRMRCVMVVSPIENYNPMQLLMLQYFTSVLSELNKLEVVKNELALANELIDLGLDQNKQGYIFVDGRGYVMRTNQLVNELFQVQDRAVGTHLKEIFPSLQFVLSCLESGRSLPLREMMLPNIQTGKSYFVECQVMKKNGHSVGMLINISDSKRINRLASQIYNARAHYTFDDLLGNNVNFVVTKNAAKQASDSSSTVLITGDSGTGKELFAQAIHNESKRSSKPFVSINCAAIPRELIGSELFGYVDGAFTGARKGGAPGKFELANNGTLFLDEIGEMPLDMQVVLLRVLEEKNVTRIGNSNPVPVNVRLIAATNKDLYQAVLLKEFRLDLYYRLNVISLHLPGLADRIDDIPILLEYFIQHFSMILKKNLTGISDEALEILKAYHWPGNIRELRNIVERSANVCHNSIITTSDLPDLGTDKTPNHNSVGFSDQYTLISKNINANYCFKTYDYGRIISLLEKYDGNKSKVAKELGITRATLYKRLKEISSSSNK